MRRNLTILTLLLLFATSALATEADYEKRLARGVAALDNGNIPLAREEFSAALNEHPNDPEATLYLAITLNRADAPEAETALKTALRLEPGNPRINLELGSYYYRQRMYEESGDYFENLLAMNPDMELKTAAEEYLANIRTKTAGKWWGITLMAGLQHDSNVPLAAADAQLPVGIDRRADWRWLFNLGFTGTAYRDNRQELTGNYSLYQTLHQTLNNFNLTQNQFDITYKRQISATIIAKIKGGFESILLGGDRFVDGLTATPGITVKSGETMTSDLEYRFRSSSFKNSATFPNNTDRNGTTHTLTLGHRHTLSETVNLHLGYTLERDLATVSAWSSTSHLGSCGVAITLPEALLLDLTVEAATRTYDTILSGEDTLRRDVTISGSASLSWQPAEHFGATLGYYYTGNNSTISGYDYDRTITSLMIQGRY